jgi:septal ring factor EnvC (AmiA/AmiB activator)
MKEKNNVDVVYALADYKQLVMGYKTKYAQLLKDSVFWKVSFVWLAVLMVCVCGVLVFVVNDTRNRLIQKSAAIEQLNLRVESVSAELSVMSKELETAKTELAGKDRVIREMEKNMSTNSKKLLDKLLKTSAQEQPADNNPVTQAK